MKLMIVVMITMLLAVTGCATERLGVLVTDGNGLPVSNALVRLGFSSGNIVFGKGKSHRYETRTDSQVKADIWFNGKSSDVGWSVSANGYYRSGPHTEVFKIAITQIPPMFYTVKMLEHEKDVSVRIWKKINPQPMYSYRLSEAFHVFNKVPVKNGRYGFDLKKGSWLPPLGDGEIADFYYVRNIGSEPMKDGSVAWLEFDEGGGAYFEKQTGCEEFPSTYCAKTNETFKTRLPFMFVRKNPDSKGVDWRDIVNADEYIVLRTRTKLDSDGNVVEANYSKILGPFRFGYAIEARCVVFNHRVNDPNLESDCRRNMIKEFNSYGFPP
jgi:hypothetical protein